MLKFKMSCDTILISTLAHRVAYSGFKYIPTDVAVYCGISFVLSIYIYIYKNLLARYDPG